MSEVIIVAILSLVGTLIGTFGGIVTASKLTNYRIEQLEKKVEKHNGVIERVYNLETKEKILEAREQTLEEEIERLRGFHEH